MTPTIKVAVVHNLRLGGAARRLIGTVQALKGLSGVELQEFCLSPAVPVVDLGVTEFDAPDLGVADFEGTHSHSTGRVRSEVRYADVASSFPRIARPVLRYTDTVRLISAWRRVAAEVNAWHPDVVFANPCSALLSAPPALPRIGAPSVYYCDEPRRQDYEVYAAKSTNPVTRGLYKPLRLSQKRLDRAAVASATRVVTNSAFTASGIANAYGRDAYVVPPGIADIFAPALTSAADSSARRVLSVGSLIPSKGHDLAIQAVGAAGLAVPLTIVTPRDNEGERRRLEGIAEAAQVELDLRFGITDTELVELYRSALATIYLAMAEPLGLVSLESQACGTPVIVSDEGGLVETVEQGVSGFRVARNAADAGAALRSLAEPRRRAAMAAAALERKVPRDCDAASAMVELFNGVLPARPPFIGV
jgi:glycosyltransferase involved in cell wall biosynthesis